jgi:hypothetical protein
MARIWHKPGVLMTAYLVLFVIALVWATKEGSASHPPVLDVGSPLIAAFLAWRVTQCGSWSRVFMIVYTIGLISALALGR